MIQKILQKIWSAIPWLLVFLLGGFMGWLLRSDKARQDKKKEEAK